MEDHVSFAQEKNAIIFFIKMERTFSEHLEDKEKSYFSREPNEVLICHCGNEMCDFNCETMNYYDRLFISLENNK